MRKKRTNLYIQDVDMVLAYIQQNVAKDKPAFPALVKLKKRGKPQKKKRWTVNKSNIKGQGARPLSESMPQIRHRIFDRGKTCIDADRYVENLRRLLVREDVVIPDRNCGFTQSTHERVRDVLRGLGVNFDDKQIA